MNEDGGLEPLSEVDPSSSGYDQEDSSVRSSAQGSYKMRHGSVMESDKSLSKMNFSFHNISDVIHKKKKPLIQSLQQVETNKDDL